MICFRATQVLCHDHYHYLDHMSGGLQWDPYIFGKKSAKELHVRSVDSKD